MLATIYLTLKSIIWCSFDYKETIFINKVGYASNDLQNIKDYNLV